MNRLIAEILRFLGIAEEVAFWTIFGISRRVINDAIEIMPAYTRFLVRSTIVMVEAGLISTLILISIKVVTGWTPAVYIAALIAANFTAALGFFWSPIGIFLGTVLNPRHPHPIQVGERYLHRVGVVIFAELMVSMVILITPFHHNLGNIPILLLAGVAFVLGSLLYGGYFSGRFYKNVAGIAFAIIFLSFFLPQTFVVVEEKAGRIDENLAAALQKGPSITSAAAVADYPLCAGPEKYEDLENGAATQIQVPLHQQCWSGWVVMPNYRFKFRISSPGDLDVKFLGRKPVFFPKENPPSLIGDIGHSFFQLRGDGQAIVSVERI